MKRILFAVCFIFIFSQTCHAELIFLKTGRTIRAKIIDKDEFFTTVEVDGKVEELFNDQIVKITNGSENDSEQQEEEPELIVEEDDNLPDSEEELVLFLLESNGTKENLENSIQMAVSKAKPEDRQVVEAIFDYDQMVMKIVPVYQKHFTKEELKEIVKFYLSPAGIKMKEVGPQLIQDTLQVTLEHVQEYKKTLQNSPTNKYK